MGFSFLLILLFFIALFNYVGLYFYWLRSLVGESLCLGRLAFMMLLWGWLGQAVCCMKFRRGFNFIITTHCRFFIIIF